MPASVSRCGGDEALTKAAWHLVHGYDLTPDEALPHLRRYNDAASPPWPESALLAKLNSADRKGGNRGWLRRPGEGERKNKPAPAPAPPKPPRPRPETFIPNDTEIAEIARVRGISPAAVSLAVANGVLSVGTNRELPAYFLHGPGIFQAKRLDGEKWKMRDGSESKVDTYFPVKGFGIRCGINQHTRTVIIIEGLVGLLEAVEAVQRAEDESGECWEGVGVIAAYSKASVLSNKNATYLSTRHVMILADAGEPGLKAAKGWRRAIKAAGGSARIRQFVQGDLGDELKRSPRCPDYLTEFNRSTKMRTNPNPTQRTPHETHDDRNSR